MQGTRLLPALHGAAHDGDGSTLGDRGAAKGQISEDDCVLLCRMVINEVGLSYIVERLLFSREEKHPWMDEYVGFVTRFTKEALVRRREANEANAKRR